MSKKKLKIESDPNPIESDPNPIESDPNPIVSDPNPIVSDPNPIVSRPASPPRDRSRDQIITYADAGRQIGKSRETIRRWANSGLIPKQRQPSGLPGVWQSDFDALYGVAQKLHSDNQLSADSS